MHRGEGEGALFVPVILQEIEESAFFLKAILGDACRECDSIAITAQDEGNDHLLREGSNAMVNSKCERAEALGCVDLAMNEFLADGSPAGLARGYYLNAVLLEEPSLPSYQDGCAVNERNVAKTKREAMGTRRESEGNHANHLAQRVPASRGGIFSASRMARRKDEPFS